MYSNLRENYNERVEITTQIHRLFEPYVQFIYYFYEIYICRGQNFSLLFNAINHWN